MKYYNNISTHTASVKAVVTLLQKKKLYVSLQQFNANELITYNCICGIFYARKAVVCLLLNYIAVSFSFWLHQLYVVVFVGAIIGRANSFPFIHNSNFIQNANEQ